MELHVYWAGITLTSIQIFSKLFFYSVRINNFCIVIQKLQSSTFSEMVACVVQCHSQNEQIIEVTRGGAPMGMLPQF